MRTNRLFRFLSLVWQDWLSRMSGIVSLVLLVLSIWVPWAPARPYFVGGAVVSALIASFRVWETTDDQLKDEKLRSSLPRLVGRVLEVQAQWDPRNWFFEPLRPCDFFVFVRLRVCNENPAETTASKIEVGFDVERGEFFGQHFESNEVLSLANASMSFPSEPPQLKCDEKVSDLAARMKQEPLRRGVEQEGWVEFLVKRVPSRAEKPELLETSLCTVTVTDAFGGRWEIRGSPPWERSGDIHVIS